MRCLLGLAAVLAASPGAAHAQTRLPQANDAYFRSAQAALQECLRVVANTSRAKNVILFVGDGMGISTMTAGRIYEGQKRGVDGESNILAMERLPFATLSQTYTYDAQVADSAPTTVAMVKGVKTRNDVIGRYCEAEVGDCAGSKGTEVASLAALAERAGLATGVVTTARITHATRPRCTPTRRTGTGRGTPTCRRTPSRRAAATSPSSSWPGRTATASR